MVPEESQLLLAAHSIEMVRAVQEICNESLEKVVLLDLGHHFDGGLRNCDEMQVLQPIKTG